MGFIGETRFSLLKPDSPDWVASNGSRFRSSEEYRNYLYSTERLDVRCEIFFDVSLPQLTLASTGVEYRHVVSYSESLPAKYQKRLEQAEREFEFLVLDRQSEGSTGSSSLEIAKQIFGPDGSENRAGTPFGWFRLDDDDLLSADYFQQMLPYITAANAGMQVSLGTGLTALVEDGRFYNPRISYSPMIAIGLLRVCMFDGSGELIRPIEVPHNQSDRFNPLILDSRKISYLWLRHPTQDTALRKAEYGSSEQLEQTLKDLSRFPRVLSMDDVVRAFPLGGERFSPAPNTDLTLIAASPAVSGLDEQGLRLETGRTDRLIQVEITLDCGPEAGAGNALLGLGLVDSEGKPLGPDVMREELRQRGLLYSEVPGIGHFRYLNLRPGQADYSTTLNLPRGVFCTSILIRRWNNSALSIRVTRCEVFGFKIRDSRGTKTKADRVFIWGSCVSRDPFELETTVDLVDYRARASLGSAFADRPLGWETQVDIDSLASPFQRRMVTTDVTKTLAGDLRNTDFDVLVLDFIDERMSTVEFGGSVVTDSPELAATGFAADAERKREPWTAEGWAQRRAGVSALLRVVDPSRIIVNRVYWATKDDAGQEFAQGLWIAKNNAFLGQLYAIFEAVPGIRFIDYPESLRIADSDHKWGRQPYHFIPALNEHYLWELETLLAAG
ncbi:DUF6270 domain-containing protein [Arthrobacter oryzae]|uniref:Putative rhamnosyltransferase n=1 Tax=Arthrobacter oryzae TaxID=409290 RepID=A0A495EQ41_9MICC|nr:DUF6270 domain-containing protein [Arthrobacter oryzae]RKR18683.1 putative rhamnosyltransferase [Arthrobacter oryzae]